MMSAPFASQQEHAYYTAFRESVYSINSTGRWRVVGSFHVNDVDGLNGIPQEEN